MKESSTAYCPTAYPNKVSHDDIVTPGQWRAVTNEFAVLPEFSTQSDHASAEAIEVRKDFVDYFNGAGALDWQWDRIEGGYWL